MVIAVDVRKKILQGVAELGVHKSFILTHTISPSVISRFLSKSTGNLPFCVLVRAAYFRVLLSLVMKCVVCQVENLGI